MFCPKCGAQLPDNTQFCTNCGSNLGAAPQPAPQPTYAPPQPTYAPPQPGYVPPQSGYVPPRPGYAPSNGNVDFGTAIKLYFQNYANFNGRASKSEYWWAFLFSFLVGLVAGWIPVVGWLVSAALFIPGLSISWRRLHDAGKSGAYYFMSLIPLVGWIFLLIALLKDSEPDNEYGPGPVMYNPNPYGNPYQPR